MALPSKLWVPDRRDVIWIDFNPQVGAELKDERPMLVLSPKASSERTKIVQAAVVRRKKKVLRLD
ncbi:MAG: type II toxin-antitoxin system PemK/MazF family toxin [Rhodoferax sp.]|nr:type II toxin-antitoxin system PemK/MazF family toxin [Rhodoferax sp.]